MKRIVSIISFLVLFTSLAMAQDTFISCLTPNMKKDMTAINRHLKANSAPEILSKDLESLLSHMIPNKGLKSEEIFHIGTKLQRFQDYYDLEAACRLSLAYTNNKKGLSGIECYIQNRRNQHPSAFQDFICAFAEYEYLIERAEAITLQGVNAPTEESKSSDVINIVHIRSELRRLEQEGIKPSKCAMANDLLMVVLKNTYLRQIKGQTTVSHLNEGVFASLNRLLCKKLDSYIQKWVQLQYPAQYIVNPIKTTVAIDNYNWGSYENSKRKEEKIYADVRELSIQGYGPASYKVGVDFETELHKKDPQKAVKHYQLAYHQGSNAGAIRLAHCLTVGYGCVVDRQQAYEILRPLTHDVDFAKNGAYAFAVLLENGYGGEADMLDIMEYYATAAEQALDYAEREAAQKRVNLLYEKYYK